MTEKKTWVGYVITGLGMVGIITSFTMQTSGYNPTAIGIAIGSILVAVGGISLIIGPGPRAA